MSKNELVAKIEALNEWEALMEEEKAEAEAAGKYQKLLKQKKSFDEQ